MRTAFKKFIKRIQSRRQYEQQRREQEQRAVSLAVKLILTGALRKARI